MAISYEQETYGKAREAAKRAYEVIPQVNASLARKLPLDKEEAIQQLTDEIWPLVQQEYAADNFTEGMSAELSKSKADDWFKMWYLGDRKYSPRLQAEQAQFDKFQDLVVDGKWYNMPQKELDLKMAELGFDPNSRDSRKQFLDVLSQHQINYDRGNIVKDELSGPYGTVSALVAPTATQEAVRQSLTGDFNDARLRGAVGTDIVASGLLGGASKLPGAVAPAAAAMGVETGRQFANMGFGNEANWGAPMMAGMAAGTVPAGAQYIGGILSRGGTTGAKPLARGFARGLRGADDPLKAERENLKNMLIAGRDASVKAQDATVGSSGPQGFVTDLAGIEGAGAYDRAAKALETLGYGSQVKLSELDRAVVTAQGKLASAERKLASAVTRMDQIIDAPRGKIPAASREAAREQAARAAELATDEADLAKGELERATLARDQYEQSVPTIVGNRRELSVEEVLGMDPRYAQNGPIQIKMPPKEGAIDIALKEGYDQPAQFSGVSKSGLPDYSTVDATKGWVGALRSSFPEKYSMEVGRGANQRRYDLGLMLGRGASDVFAPFETATQATPTEVGSGMKERKERFKQSEWFQNLPKEKKLAIERALKGEK